MITSPYIYQVELFAPDGASLGKAPLAVDWEPAREWTRFTSARAGRIPFNAVERAASARPVWNAGAGEPFVDGFEVALSVGEMDVSARFGTEYFVPLARGVLERLRGADGIKTAEANGSVRFVTTAYPAAAGDGAAGRFQAREIAPDIPVTDVPIAPLVSRSAHRGDESGSEMPLFVPDHVLREAGLLAEGTSAVETGGILIGRFHRDPSTGALFAEVTAQLPARHTESTSTSLVFTAQTWTDVRAALALRGAGESMLGWWHSHPVREWCSRCSADKQRECSLADGFMSEHDRALHRTVFPRAYSVALVVSVPAEGGPRFAMFGWRDGLVDRRGFHVLSTAEGID